MNPLINPLTSKGASIFAKENAAPETDENGGVESVVAPEQNAEHQRRKGIGRDQPAVSGSQEANSCRCCKARARSLVAASCRKMMPKTEKAGSCARNVFG